MVIAEHVRAHGMYSSSKRHVLEQYANNLVEADHSRLKAWLRPMRGLKTVGAAQTIAAGHPFVQNLRRGHYEITADCSSTTESAPRSTTTVIADSPNARCRADRGGTRWPAQRARARLLLRGWPPPVLRRANREWRGSVLLAGSGVRRVSVVEWVSRLGLLAGPAEARVDIMHHAGPPIGLGDRFRTR
jgi:hypothetical protein